MALITVSSDYGYKDPYRAMVHGVLADLAPDIRVVDLSHDLAPGNLYDAGFVIGQAMSSFPAGTVHLILNGELAGGGVWLAMELGGQFFVAANNGVLSVLQSSHKAKALRKIEFGEQEGSMFPGRDFLAKAAVHLAKGGAIGLLGKALEDIYSLQLPKPTVDNVRRRVRGEVVYVDNYGNLITNLGRKELQEVFKSNRIEINLPRSRSLTRISRSYQDIPQDGLLALINSLGLLEIAFSDPNSREINGASSLLGLRVTSEISITYE